MIHNPELKEKFNLLEFFPDLKNPDLNVLIELNT